MNESEYESEKAKKILQYFDKIYTLCYGTSNFSTLIDTLIQKKYARMCQPVFKRLHTDVFKSEYCWHVTYYLLHSLWNYTDKTNAMSIVCDLNISSLNTIRFVFFSKAFFEAQFLPLLIFNLKHENFLKNFASNDVNWIIFKWKSL